MEKFCNRILSVVLDSLSNYHETIKFFIVNSFLLANKVHPVAPNCELLQRHPLFFLFEVGIILGKKGKFYLFSAYFNFQNGIYVSNCGLMYKFQE